MDVSVDLRDQSKRLICLSIYLSDLSINLRDWSVHQSKRSICWPIKEINLSINPREYSVNQSKK